MEPAPPVPVSPPKPSAAKLASGLLASFVTCVAAWNCHLKGVTVNYDQQPLGERVRNVNNSFEKNIEEFQPALSLGHKTATCWMVNTRA